MKFINKTLIIVFLLGFVSSCDNLDMDLQVDPNQITPDKASLNDLYNSIQLGFGGIYAASEGAPGQAVRMYGVVAFTYEAMATTGTMNGLWNQAYAQLFPNIDALLVLAEDQGFDFHAGAAKIMKAYTLMILVDLLGDVPYAEAGQGTDVISPMPQSGQEVYNAALALLDEAIAQLSATSAAAPTFELFFNGSKAKWITLANTLKMRAALNTGDASAFNAVISGGDFIDDPSEDFEARLSNNRSNPDSRHYFYQSHYESGDGAYLSNYYMWMLRSAKVNAAGNTVIDPRIRYYFYRKVDDAFGLDPTVYGCHFTALPTEDASNNIGHWSGRETNSAFANAPDLPYCVEVDGYYGRDHLNGQGIPPDGQIRTSYGLYPGAGDFDDSSFGDTRNSGTTGGLGAGIFPMMLSSFVDFMRAEAVLSLGANGDARVLLESGIRKSLDKVQGFESLVSSKMSTTVTLRDGSEGTIRELYGMDDTDKQDYVDEVLAFYDAANGTQEKLDVVIREFYIAAWGNGLEAYNMYRRTGYPGNMQPALEPIPGSASDPFPYSFIYPVDHIVRNANAVQKVNAGVPVFWQNTSLNLY